jgi:hypothetical protein
MLQCWTRRISERAVQIGATLSSRGHPDPYKSSCVFSGPNESAQPSSRLVLLFGQDIFQGLTAISCAKGGEENMPVPMLLSSDCHWIEITRKENDRK